MTTLQYVGTCIMRMLHFKAPLRRRQQDQQKALEKQESEDDCEKLRSPGEGSGEDPNDAPRTERVPDGDASSAHSGRSEPMRTVAAEEGGATGFDDDLFDSSADDQVSMKKESMNFCIFCFISVWSFSSTDVPPRQ